MKIDESDMNSFIPVLVLFAVAASLALSIAAIFLSYRKNRRIAVPISPAPSPRQEGTRPMDDLVEWTPQMLRKVLADVLPDGDVIVVSNREPYSHEWEGGKLRLHVPASGLVSALEPVTRACGGTWIAHGSGSADRETVDKDDRLAVPPDKPSYTLRRVWLSEEEQKGYYAGFANEGLWPLCHIAFTRPIFRASDWECYQAVNRKFADIVVEEARTTRPIVLVQDYHFALLPRLIREKLPDAVIITFWHIPWPNSEIFGVCPWREEILDGLLGSSILGFHIKLHCNNFIDSVDRFLESRIDRESSSISYGGEVTAIYPYPISIEWPEESGEPRETLRKRIFSEFGLPVEMKMALGVERLDYTKGILDRFRAMDEFFQHHSDWIGRFVFVQVAAPSRSSLDAYGELHQECLRLVAEINERYGDDDYSPIILIDEHRDRSAINELYRAADFCVVSSLHDGMNLVAKEYIAARDDDDGVLVLSTFAGASRELSDAVLVNPFDTAGMGEAFFAALSMPAEERAERMRRLRETVRRNNVYKWAGSMLLDAVRVREQAYPFVTGEGTARYGAQVQ